LREDWWREVEGDMIKDIGSDETVIRVLLQNKVGTHLLTQTF